MVTIYEQKDRKQVINQQCIKVLSKLTGWSIDEMHAWPPYMKQRDRKRSTLHQNFEQTYNLDYR